MVLPDNGAALLSFGHSDLVRHSPAVPKHFVRSRVIRLPRRSL